VWSLSDREGPGAAVPQDNFRREAKRDSKLIHLLFFISLLALKESIIDSAALLSSRPTTDPNSS